MGKSTLFNALTETAAAQAENFPFCTIDPNIGEVAVPDSRLDALAKIADSAQIMPTRLSFVDIAGLVRGASKGEGLGNQFLSNIREVDAIIHVIRCFDDDGITHVEGRIEPCADAETVNTELMLADLDSLERRIQSLRKRSGAKDKQAMQERALIDLAFAELQAGRPARAASIPKDGLKAYHNLQLLTAKPVLYVCNVAEQDANEAAIKSNPHIHAMHAQATCENAEVIHIAAQIEEEIAQLPSAERAEYLTSLGLTAPGLERLVQAAYRLLGLVSFFTAGPKEARAWTVSNGTRAPQAAGVIHGDFERGFIRAETIAYDDYIACQGESGAREAGRMRQEGKDYIVQDGDVMLFRFNV